MKKRILNISLILLLGSTGSVLAQQGIGTNRPDKSAAVDIKSTNKGLLIPRMQLSWDGTKISAPTIDSPAQGLLVYNLTTVTNVPEGFYYFSNDLWNPIGVSELENSETTIITGNGTASLPYQVQVKTADSNTLGIVKPGNGLTIDSGTLNVIAADGRETKLTAGNFITITGDGSANTPYLISSRDNQELKFDTTTNQLTISGDTNVINLVGLKTILNKGVITTLTGTGSATDPYIVDITKESIQENQIKYEVINGVNTTALLDDSSTSDLKKYKVNVATADSNTLGVVQIGSGINVNNGVISVPAAPGETTTLIANTLTKGNKQKIADYKNETTNTPVDIFETITSITYDTATNVTHINEDTSTLVFNLIDEVHKHQKTTTVVGNGAIKVNPTAPSTTGNTAYTVSVDTATATTLGVVKPGTGITVASDGTLNVLAQADTVTTLTGVKTTGNAIGTYKNEAGTDVVINETITSIKFDSATTTLTYTPENGVANNIELNLGSIDTDKQQLRLDSNTLTLDRSTSVDLTKYLDNTDNQSLSFDTSLHVLKITGDTNTIDFSNYKNKLYTLASDSNTISLLADGTAVDSEFVVKDVALNLSTDNKLTTAVNGVSNAIALDLSSIDTDKQTITDLSLSGTTLTASLERGNTKTVDLSSLKDPITTNVLTVAGSDSNTLQSSVNGTPSNIINLVDKVVLELNGKNLTAKVNGVANTTALDLSTIDTDAQQLKLESNTLTLDRSASVDLSVLRTKLDTGTNTTLVGNGTAALPYQVGVNAGNGTTLGVVRQATDNPTVNVTNGELAVNLTNTVLSGEVTGPLNNTIVKDNVIDTANLMDSAVTTTKIHPATGDTSTSKVLTTNKDGVVEWSTSARPDFFYYPAINIKLDTNTLDLYGIYKNRWENTNMPKSTNTEESSLASLVLPANMIDIYITYYDTNVIDSIQISNAGVMTYTLKPNYSVTDESYMNIVFKVRKSPRN